MKRLFLLAVLALIAAAVSVIEPGRATSPAQITGKYIEARTCDIWTGPCFANAEMNLTGKHAVMGWKVEQGELQGVRLDGLGVVAIIAASDTLGLVQTGKSQAVLIVDSRADAKQSEALAALARKQGGALVENVVAVHRAKVDLDVCDCAEGGCAVLDAGCARISTRCLDDHDKICGNEYAFYPPLARDLAVRPAFAVEHTFTGQGVNATWNDAGRRGAYLGQFAVR